MPQTVASRAAPALRQTCKGDTVQSEGVLSTKAFCAPVSQSPAKQAVAWGSLKREKGSPGSSRTGGAALLLVSFLPGTRQQQKQGYFLQGPTATWGHEAKFSVRGRAGGETGWGLPISCPELLGRRRAYQCIKIQHSCKGVTDKGEG